MQAIRSAIVGRGHGHELYSHATRRHLTDNGRPGDRRACLSLVVVPSADGIEHAILLETNGDPVLVSWVLVGGDLEHARGWEDCPWAEGLGLVPEGRQPTEWLADLLAGVGVEF